jgi:hypothetical protein
LLQWMAPFSRQSYASPSAHSTKAPCNRVINTIRTEASAILFAPVKGWPGKRVGARALVFHMAALPTKSGLIRLSQLKWRSTCRSRQGGVTPEGAPQALQTGAGPWSSPHKLQRAHARRTGSGRRRRANCLLYGGCADVPKPPTEYSSQYYPPGGALAFSRAWSRHCTSVDATVGGVSAETLWGKDVLTVSIRGLPSRQIFPCSYPLIMSVLSNLR